MALTNHDQTRIRQYLLGHLSDEEQQKIEERLMVEDELFQELEISKGELIEDYCAGELTEKEHNWFEQNYLSSPEGRQRHTFTVALNCLKRPIPVLQPVTALEQLRSFLQRWRWAVPIAASAALVVVIAVGWQMSRRTLNTSPKSYAFTLNSTVGQRSPGDARYHRVQLSPEIGELRITLKLPEGVTRGTNYRVELDDRGKTSSLNATSPDASSVLVVIPTAQLREGLYALRLYSTKDDGTVHLIPGEYLFRTN